MSISGVSSSSALAYLLQLFGQQKTSGAENNPLKTQIESALGQMGYSADQISTISEEIGTAIQEAMAKAGSDGDMKSITKSAIESVLEENGVDATAFQTAMESVGGPQRMGPPPPPPSGSGGISALLESVAEELDMATSEVTDLLSQVDSAVETALAGLGADEDARAAIESAINSLLEENDLDAETLLTAFQSAVEEQDISMEGLGRYGSQGQVIAAATSGSTESELLGQLLAQFQSSSSETSSSDSSALSLWQMLQSLPGGSLIDTTV